MNDRSQLDATFYVQLEPTWVSNYYRSRGEPPTGARAVRISQKKPARPVGGTVTAKLTIRMPAASFLPLAPEAIVVVPADFLDGNPIEVEASDANNTE